MTRPSAMEQEFAAALARLICVWYWRAHEIGQHLPYGAPCRSCQRLVEDDLYGLLRQMLGLAVRVGAAHAPEPSLEVMQEVADRCARLCADRVEPVLASDPRIFERQVERSRTDHADVVFALKESPDDGPPWIMLEPAGPVLPILKAGNAFLGLTFRPSVSFQDAQRLVHEMYAKLRGVSCTSFLSGSPPLSGDSPG